MEDQEIKSELGLTPEERDRLWKQTGEIMENYLATVAALPVQADLSGQESGRLLQQFDFEKPVPAEETIAFVATNLQRYGVHASHPGYFGLSTLRRRRWV
jgi:hypothetical protein